MYKYGKNKRFIKPLSLAFLSGVFALGLTSCGKKTDVYKDINGDDTYVTLGDYKVTNKEIYDSLRWNANDLISGKKEEAVIKNQIDKVKEAIENPESENHNEYIKLIQEYIVCDIFGIDSYDNYKDLNNPYSIRKLKAKFIDNVYKDYNISITLNDIETLSKRDGDECKVEYTKLNENCKKLIAKYYKQLAKRLFASIKLEQEIKDFNDGLNDGEDRYFSNTEIKDYWKKNYLRATDANAILIRFLSETEVNNVLKAFGLKVYREKFYFIKQQGVLKDNNENAVDLTDAQYSKWYDDFEFDKELSYGSSNAVPLTDNDIIFALYIEMYNYIYSYRESLKRVVDLDVDSSNRRNVTQSIYNYFIEIKGNDELTNKLKPENYYNEYLKDNEELIFNQEKLDKISTNLTTYLYDTLKFEKQNDNYSLKGQSYGDYYYMAYKINDPKAEQKLYYVAEDENDELYYVELEDNQYVVYTYDGNNKNKVTDSNLLSQIGLDTEDSKKAYYELLNEIYAGLTEETLTKSYIENAVSDAAKDVKISIYDKAMEISYLSKNSDYSKTKKSAPAGNVVARFTYKNKDLGISKITLDVTSLDVWEELEVKSGISTATSLLSTKIIKDTDEFKAVKNDKDKIDTYYSNLNVLLANFASNQLQSYGFDSSLGKYNFLMLYFHDSDIKNIIDNYYVVNEASTKLMNDYSSTTLAKYLQGFANNYYDTSFKVSATDLLVYVDMDEDGNPDKTITCSEETTFDWSKNVPNSDETYGQLAQELINKVIKLIDNSSSSGADTIKNIITEYNSSSRFRNGYDLAVDSEGNYDPTGAEREWAKYRKAGLYIKTNELTDVTNSTQLDSINDVLKIAVYNAYKNGFLFDEETMPNEYVLSSYYKNGNTGLVSQDGYNLVLLTSASSKDSAKFELDDDKNGLYQDLIYNYNDKSYKISDVFSEKVDGEYTNHISLNQVRTFMLEYGISGSSSSLPTSVTTALNTYLQPALTRYTGEQTQFEIILYFMINNANVNKQNDKNAYEYFEFTKSDINHSSADRFKEILDINHRNVDDYVDYSRVYEGNNPLTFMGDSTTDEYARLLAELQNQYSNWWSDIASLVKDLTKEEK